MMIFVSLFFLTLLLLFFYLGQLLLGLNMESGFILNMWRFIPLFFAAYFIFLYPQKKFNLIKRLSLKSLPELFQTKTLPFLFAMSLCFSNYKYQKNSIYKNMRPLNFSSKEFENRDPVVPWMELISRAFLTKGALAKSLSFTEVDKSTSDYLSSVVKEAAEVMAFRDYVKKNNIFEICKVVKEGECVIKLYQDLFEDRAYSSTGNVLSIAVFALLIFKQKDKWTQEIAEGEKKFPVLLRASNNLMDVNARIMGKNLKSILNLDQYQGQAEETVHGYKFKDGSTMSMMELTILYKFHITAAEKMADLTKKISKKIEKAESEDPDSLDDFQVARFRELKMRYDDVLLKNLDLYKKKARENDARFEAKVKSENQGMFGWLVKKVAGASSELASKADITPQ